MSLSGGAIQNAMNALNASSAALLNPAGVGAAPAALTPEGGEAATPAPFADLLTDAVGQVNQLDEQARVAVEGLMTGSGVDVHQAMIATEKASMAFELALAVRNKAVEAYQAVMGMQF